MATRTDAMPPSRKWTDPMLDERFQAIRERLDDVMDALGSIREIPKGVAEAVNRSEDRMREEVREMRAECTGFFSEYREKEEERGRADRERGQERWRNAIVLIVAAVGLIGTLVAAMIGAHVI